MHFLTISLLKFSLQLFLQFPTICSRSQKPTNCRKTIIYLLKAKKYLQPAKKEEKTLHSTSQHIFAGSIAQRRFVKLLDSAAPYFDIFLFLLER